MIKQKLILIFFIALFGCGPSEHSEIQAVKFAGKPVSLKYRYHLNHGNLRWKLSGDVKGRVGLCMTNDCGRRIDQDFYSNCPKLEMLMGRVTEFEPRHSGEEGVTKGTCRNFLFIPEKGSTGEIRVTFIEN